ncbi:glycosyltransferase [Metabacillus sp. GX 13764]|uniref:glycosyltransferase n=1 Tax=Metabacillus kandeliae TaxID=2900151 RepID=UPI001E61263B|nr:glycosyltransferase [Metabacillus kandeliae]MCD7034498.1 glycosyltransferase [Metabacillus kandeliae]
MKIAILAPANNVHTKKWLDYYNKLGYETLNISFESHRDGDDRSKWQNVKTHYLPLKFSNKLAYFLTVGDLKKVLNEFKPDLLHSHYVSSYGVVGAMANFHPYIISVWGMDIYDFPKEGKINAAMVKYALKKADVICSTSHVMKDETAKYTNKPIEVTPFGVDMEKFKPSVNQSHEDKIRFGIVKTMAEKYGIRYLLEGYAKFRGMVRPEQFEATHLDIVGPGPKLEEYKQLAKELGIDHQTTFHGRVPHEQVPAFINSFDVFFVPSTLDSESFGVAAVEAQACEVPVVVANVGGLPEVVKDGETGYIVPTKNSSVLAEKMKLFIENPEIGKEMGAKGRRHVVSLYEWEDNAKLMADIYEKTLGRKVSV